MRVLSTSSRLTLERRHLQWFYAIFALGTGVLVRNPGRFSQVAVAGVFSMQKWLTALPVYNEAKNVATVLTEVCRHAADILVVDDGSSDATPELLQQLQTQNAQIAVLRHAQNSGYGAALLSAFDYAIQHNYEGVVTIDCDGQHVPQRIPNFIEACQTVDIVSGSRYLKKYEGDSDPPPQRLYINQQITAEINERLGLHLTDAFCGFKAYKTAALKKMTITELGYAMPLELWVQAAAAKLSILEIPVPLIYLDATRSFGVALDHAATRLEYYHTVLNRAMQAAGMVVACQESMVCHPKHNGL
jgi:glycosyltransferase involved in cell wall biosynthesis